MYLYTARIIVSWRFTVLLWAEIDRTSGYHKGFTATAISPYFDLTDPPTHA